MLRVQTTPVLLVSIYGLDDSSLVCSEYWLKVRLEEFVGTLASGQAVLFCLTLSSVTFLPLEHQETGSLKVYVHVF